MQVGATFIWTASAHRLAIPTTLNRSKYENEVVKLTIQIDEPTMMMIEKDVSASFSDRLGVLGKIGNDNL